MSPKHDDCEKCEDHMAWEEKMKKLDYVPELVDWMNQEKGGKAMAKILLSLFIGVPFTIMLYLITSTRSDMNDFRMCTQKSIESISSSANQIQQNVAVLTSSFSMHREGNFKEHEAIRRDIPAIVANQINIEKNSGKK